MKATWKPTDEHGELDAEERNDLPDSAYAFPDKRKEPLTDASHYDVDLSASNWYELGKPS